MGVRQLAGPAEIEAAWERGERVEVLLTRTSCSDPAVAAVVARARELGIRVHTAGPTVLRRLSRVRPAADVLGLVGRSPEADLQSLFSLGGAVWLLVGVSYPGNAGFAIRTAEVSGADGIVLDAPEFDHVARRQATRTAMRADRYMPVLWERAALVLDRARDAGCRLVGIEDTGTVAPWEADLVGPVLFIVGGEDLGTPPEVLERCDTVVKIPMGGFIRSYNLQTAVAVVAAERLRQRAGC